WVWPLAALALAIWMERAARRNTTPGIRWLVYPAISLVTVAALGGTLATVTVALDDTSDTMPGALYDVGGHRLHLTCTGTGSPTVVLENGLNEISPLWSAVTTQVSRTTRVCAYDRAGQGWSDDISHPQDARAVAADLHTLLARAGEHGPYILAGHSSGGTLAMTYAARHPAQVAGMVLLDSSSPHQYTDQPDFAGTFAMMRRLLPVTPALARVAATRLIPASPSTALSPEAAAQVEAFATSPRGARNMRDEQSELLNVFTQAQALTTFDPKPLAVVTARENADSTKGWAAAQDRMATLSTNITHWTADTTHVGLLDDATGSTNSVRAITAVVTAVRTGTPLTSR
ncbi:MAG: alpha/beta fold hydrolase, partial [Actinomycetes bacterium]